MKDLYANLRGSKKEPSKKDFKDSVLDLFDKYLKRSSITVDEKTKIYRLKARIEIELRGF